MNWIIYTLKDPRTNEVRYVGVTTQTSQSRFWGHRHDALHRPKHGNGKKNQWLQSLLSAGLEPVIETVASGFGDAWEDAERYWIFHYRSIGAPLLNKRDGGNAAMLKFDPERLSEISKKANAAWTPEQREAWKVKIHSNEAQRRTSLKQFREKQTPSQRRAQLQNALGKLTPEVRQATLEKRWSNPEDRRAWSAKLQAAMTPEKKAASTEKLKANLTPAQREAWNLRMLGGLTTEERIANGKRNWANKTDEQRQEQIERLRRAVKARTPEQCSATSIKAYATRRLRAAAAVALPAAPPSTSGEIDPKPAIAPLVGPADQP